MRLVLMMVFGLGLVGFGAEPRVTQLRVKKSTHTLEVYAGTGLVKTYKVSTGFGGLGPKTREGDGRTPVGRYHIVKHMPSHLRLFMLLDYPNDTDRARFEGAKARGELPANATIGGDVGIHGEPPWAKPIRKETYTSHGCVVLTDAEIDELASRVPDGTVVDIED